MHAWLIVGVVVGVLALVVLAVSVGREVQRRARIVPDPRPAPLAVQRGDDGSALVRGVCGSLVWLRVAVVVLAVAAAVASVVDGSWVAAACQLVFALYFALMPLLLRGHQRSADTCRPFVERG